MDGVTRIKPTRNTVILEVLRDEQRPIVHIECKDEGARPQLEELARRVLVQIALA